MNNKTITLSYAIIGAAVATSFIFTKKLEWDANRFAKKMEQDMVEIKNDIANLGK